jgi:hypothetical protein
MKSIPQHTLKAEDLHQMVLQTAQSHIQLETKGNRCTPEQTWDILVKASCESRSVEAICQETASVVSGNTLREHLKIALPLGGLRQQEREVNAALSSAIPAAMPRGGIEVAIDSHDEPYYGKTEAILSYTRKTKANRGTTHVFRIASAYVIWREVRLTLAITYMLPEDTVAQVVDLLLQRLQALGLHATVLYLDKGFCCGEVIQRLEARQQATILACPIRGKKGGIRALCRGRGSYTTSYTFSDGTPVQLVLVQQRIAQRDQGKKRRIKWLAFVLVQVTWTPAKVFQKYRRRFGIESSYRLLRQVKVRTNSRNIALRFFLLALALLVQNVWVKARWLFTRCPSKGRYVLNAALLTFDTFCKLIVLALEARHPPRHEIRVFVSPNSVIH